MTHLPSPPERSSTTDQRDIKPCLFFSNLASRITRIKASEKLSSKQAMNTSAGVIFKGSLVALSYYKNIGYTKENTAFKVYIHYC